MPTNQRPNLDYEPGPVGASYSRLGPPPEQDAPDRTGPDAMEQYRHEVGQELAPPARSRRRHNRSR